MSADPMDIKAIFGEAMEKPTAEQRRSYLDEACADRPEVRAQVEELLALHEGAGSFLESPPFDLDVTLAASPLTEGPGTVIGRYKLLEKIGEGGMAAVYMAEQEQPIRRKVALKVIKLGMDSRSVVARFEVERQALALMDHPNIAKVFDAGLTEAGRPYFVMELVRGIAITEYCDQNKLSTGDRLELFIQVCHAVQHAHQKGIIHRDIKPSNVMVTLHDGQPLAVVIDFGIAKATSQRLTEKTLFTRYAQLIGTPEYMSPEQAEMNRLDVDTRTDIYSLGVLLYELLTGSTPFDAEQLRQAGYAGIQRIIRETEPQRPSTKLSTLGKTLTDVALSRRTTAEALPRQVRGDLDWIVMKTLEKDRTRRYETAHALAQDIERHLSNEPILAGPPRTLDRCRKFVRRNRGLVIGVVAVGVTLMTGVVVSTRFAMGQSRALKEVRQQADRYQAIATFLQKDVFGTLNPWRDGGRDVLIEELLGTATKRVGGSFADQPLVEASLRTTLGATYQRLGKYEEAEPHLVRALELHRRLLGDRDPATLATTLELGLLYFFAAREPEAEPIFAEVLSDSRSVLGPRHETTITSMVMLATVYLHARSVDKAGELASEALKVAQDALGPDHEMTAGSLLILGTVRHVQGRTDEAAKLLTAGVETAGRLWGPKHPETVHFMCNLSSVYADQGLLDKARETAEVALERARAAFGEPHRQTLVALAAQAYICYVQKEFDKAESWLLEMRNICKQQKAELRPWFLPEELLGEFYHELHRYAEAEPYARQALQQVSAKWGTRSNWPRCAWVLADTEFHLGRYEEGQKILEELLDALREDRVEIDPYVAPNLNDLAWVLATHPRAELRNGSEAVRWAIKACELTEWENGEYLDTLAATYAEAGDFEAAVKWEKKALELAGSTLPERAKAGGEFRLKLYESGRPYRQPEPPLQP